jgi:hypothetical protein
MEHLCDLYAKHYDPLNPVLCFDEKSKQSLANERSPIAAKEGSFEKIDYEYKRNGTRNLFVAVEPLDGWRNISVTKRRTRKDFANEIKRIIELPRYQNAKTIHFVLDNLNTHFEKSFVEAFGQAETMHIMEKIQFHYTPKHASWLNMAEMEIGILDRESIRGRIGTEEKLIIHTNAYQKARNDKKSKITWKFTTEKAREKFKYEVNTNLQN